MKSPLSYILVLAISSYSCSDESVAPEAETQCSLHAVVEGQTGLDGCGYLLKLDNGEYLDPVWRWGFCGTPPFPKGATEDPLWNFTFEDGMEVMLDFEAAENWASDCMKGAPVIITCIDSIGITNESENL